MALLDELADNGVDVKDGLERLMNNQELYERLIKKLPDSIAQNPVTPFLDSGDIDKAINNAHAIKGVTGNLSVTPLFKAYTSIVAFLRAGKIDEGRALYESTLPMQERIISIIRKY